MLPACAVKGQRGGSPKRLGRSTALKIEKRGCFLATGTASAAPVPGSAPDNAARRLSLQNRETHVGYFVTGPLLNDIHGFLYSEGTFTQLDVPGSAAFTEAEGINNDGDIVGLFVDNRGIEHGFLATPVSAVTEPSSLALFGVGVIGIVLVRRLFCPKLPFCTAEGR